MMLLLIYFLKKFDAFHLLYFTLKMARSTWGKEICIVFVFYSCVKLNFCCTGGVEDILVLHILYPWKFQTKQGVTLTNSTKFCYTSWTF